MWVCLFYQKNLTDKSSWLFKYRSGAQHVVCHYSGCAEMEGKASKEKKKPLGNKVMSSYFRELLSLEISRTPFLTWTYKRLIGTDAEMEKILTSNALIIHIGAQTAPITQNKESRCFTAFSEKRFRIKSHSLLVINIFLLCPVSGAPLWPSASLLLFTVNGHWHISTLTCSCPTHTRTVWKYLPLD